MANIQKRANAYKITAYSGYDTNGKQIRHTMTYKPSADLSPAKLKKELEKVALEFEEKCNLGYVMDSNIKLIDFIEIWFKNYVGNKNLSPVTVRGYQNESLKIIEELGHIKMGQITPKHIQDFYAKIKGSTGVRGGEKFTVTPEYLATVASMKQKVISDKAGINDDALRRLKKGGNTTREIACRVTDAIGKDFDTLFISTNPQREVSNETVLHYHKLLNNIMNTAVKWGVIPFNPIEKRVELPKSDRKEPAYMDDKEALAFLELLEEEPIKYKLALNLLIFSGLRRGEIGGLKWAEIDFNDKIITVKRALKYVAGEGLFEGDPKTFKSRRSIKLPDFVFDLFNAYKVWQLEERLKVGDRWQDHDFIFTRWNGEPMSLDTIGGHLKKFTDKHGLKPVHLHSLRHTNASILIASGVDLKTVSSRLGHSNLSTTGNIYAHVINSADTKASDALDHILVTKGRKAQ